MSRIAEETAEGWATLFWIGAFSALFGAVGLWGWAAALFGFGAALVVGLIAIAVGGSR